MNDQQRRAVLATDGPLLVLAGAGSGKTRVLVTRIAYMARACGIPARQILGITFTRKAAHEMRERLAGMLDPDDAESVALGTFHAIGVLLLREYGGPIGLPPKFGIAAEDDVTPRIRALLKAQGVPRDAEKERPKDVQARIAAAKLRFADRVARDVLEGALDPSDVLARYRSGDPDIWTAEADQLLDVPSLERFQAQYAAYQRRLAEDGVVDYEDLLCLPLLLFLQRPEVLRLVQARWRYVLVDEYQDTDYVQDHLLRLLAGPSRNLCAVGDDDQAIYSWRGAKVENIRTFPARYAPCAMVTLDQNYRSTGTILDVANATLAARREPGRLPKTLWTRGMPGGPVRLWTCASQEAEAEAVARDIKSAVEARTIERFDDVMVLYRMNALARPVEAAFRRNGVPFRILNGLSLLERTDVRDTLAYLRLAANEFDAVSFERAVAAPARGIGPATVEALVAHARVRGQSLLEAALSADSIAHVRPAQRKTLLEFAGMVRDVAAVAQAQGVATAVREVLARTELEQTIIAALAEAEHEEDDDEVKACNRRLTDLTEFTLYVEGVCRARGGATHPGAGPEAGLARPIGIDELLDELMTAGVEDDPDGRDLGVGDLLGRVGLMSVHSAKGLEAPRVYVIGLEEGVFPTGVQYGEDAETVAEEGRLFYVAITRAQRELVLSASRTREVRTQDPKPMVRSRFVASIPETLYRPETQR